LTELNPPIKLIDKGDDRLDAEALDFVIDDADASKCLRTAGRVRNTVLGKNRLGYHQTRI
jgi:hypothetical protein